MNRLQTRLVVAGAAMWSALGVCALAQETSPPPQPPEETKPAEEAKPEESREDVFTEVITVTSMKREQELKDVPMSVAAPTEELLRSRGADDMETLSANVASFSVQNLGPGQSQIAMRGVSGGQIVRDQPGVKEQVGVYFDESVISLSLFTPDIDLFDVSRVEVLRGPQGTLFGSGSLGGTVRYISNQPEIGSEDRVAEVAIGAIDGGDVGGDVKAAVNVPMGDKAAMRITAYYNALAGYTDAIQPGGGVDKDVNTGDRTGARVAMRFAPNDHFTITPRYFYQKVTGDGWNREDLFNILANPFTTTRPQVHIGEREVFTQIEEPFTDKFQLADLNLAYTFGGGASLTSVTSYIDRDVLVVRDATALTASVNGGTLGTAGFCPHCADDDVFAIDAPLDDATQVQTWSEELRLSSPSGGRFNWVAGGFYSTTDKHYGQSLIVDGFQDQSGLTFSTTVPDFTYTVKDELYWSTLDYNLDQWAVFGEGTWSVSDRFNLTGGLRWYDFNEDKHQIFDGLFADFGGQVNDNSTSADGLAPRLIASWAVGSLTRLNAQVSRGFRLGGVNDPILRDLCTPADLVAFGGFRTWEDETAWNYEIGTKSSIMGGRGSFNVSAFYMDISDLQAVVTAGTCSSRIVVNVPQAHSAGLELELSAATSDHFDFSVTASYDDSQLDSTVGAASAAVSGLREGNRLPSVPKFQASAAATYQWTVNQSWLGYLTGTYQHVGSRFTQFSDYAAGFGTVNLTSFPNDIGGPYTQNTFTFDPELPAYDLINLRFGLVIGQWDAALYVNNVTDETALLSLDRERGTLARVGFITNQPRTYGISTRVHF